MSTPQNTPLAARMRPRTLDEVVGQSAVTEPGSPLRAVLEGRTTASVLLWAGPGTGKTTLAHILGEQLAKDPDAAFIELSAISAGVKDVRAAIDAAQKRHAAGGRSVLFLDEIHRFTKAQQDSLLHAMETGWITLIGATTENPSFSVNSAIASRCVLVVLERLTEPDLVKILGAAVEDPRGLDGAVDVTSAALELIARLADADARQGLNRLELAANVALSQSLGTVDADLVDRLTGAATMKHDADGDAHYNVISAFIKSMRGSDPDAALHWLARMIEGGEDPRFIARRLIVHASEDVGMAAPEVLGIAVAAAQAVQLIGMPEARINLAQATVAIAVAPKSPAIIRGIDSALADVRAGRTAAVPTHLRDAHYPGAKALGHGADYLYPHDFPYGVVAQQYMPEVATGGYYRPVDHGHEAAITARLAAIERMQQGRS